MRWTSCSTLCFDCLGWDRWVVQQAQLVVMTRVLFQYVVLVQVQADSKRSEDLSTNSETLPVEAVHKVAEPRKAIIGQPLIRLVGILVAAYVIAFLWQVSGATINYELIVCELWDCQRPEKEALTLTSTTSLSWSILLWPSVFVACDTFSSPGQE
jgi:hypothetical protein